MLMRAGPEVCGQSPQFAWTYPRTLAASLLLHAMAAGATVVWVGVHPAPPSAVPQIILAPPAAMPPAEEAARPSPHDADPKPDPAFARPGTMPRKTIAPLTTTQSRADAVVPQPSPHAEPQKPTDPAQLAAAPVTDQRKSDSSSAASAPVSDSKTSPDDRHDDSHNAGPPPDYIGLIEGRLQKLLRYPSQALAAHQQGVALLRFTLDRSGHLTSWNLVTSSGVPALDQETGALVQRAAPFPPFPASWHQDSLRLTVPVEFNLKKWADRTQP